MTRVHHRTLLAGLALMLCAPVAMAGETYVSIGLGLASDEIDASTIALNHPTRCDRLLYANPSSAPSDAACLDTTHRLLFSDSFDLGSALAGSASVGYAWERFRLEAEFLGRSHDARQRPAIAAAGNVAAEGKILEWNDHKPPYYRVSGFKSRQLLVNAYYAFGRVGVWTPFVGVGAGVARVDGVYSASYMRRTLADGYVAAVGGDPAQPEDWQIAAAGSDSRLDTEFSDEVFGYQLTAGVERELAERTRAFFMLRWTDFGDISHSALWSTIRSHAPVQADGITPFTSDNDFENIGGLTATVGIRYGF